MSQMIEFNNIIINNELDPFVMKINNDNNTTYKNINETNIFEEVSTEEFSISTIAHIIILSIILIHILYLILMLIKINFYQKKKKKAIDINKVIQDKENNLKKINNECCICLEEIANEVQLLCSHSFCATCIIEFAKFKYSMKKIKCPVCRYKSRLIIIKFVKDESNIKLYQEIMLFNHKTTSTMTTSFCFVIDTFRFFFYYVYQILDLNNSSFAGERVCFMILGIIVVVVMIYPFLVSISNFLLILQDIVVYLGFIFYFGNLFYRRFRRNTNNEVDLMLEARE